MKPSGSEAPQADAHAGVRESQLRFRVVLGLADGRGRTCLKQSRAKRPPLHMGQPRPTGQRPHHDHPNAHPSSPTLSPGSLFLGAGWRVSTPTPLLRHKHALPPSILCTATPP